ncbi:MAG: argininosuccinate lyase [candidate division CPR3 bacterium GW2011_GWE2_35_7]|nr:MAG: argininosuccinate lyase [candidate division CPR3 bacterium GW2011_GWE2_35_7]
MVFNLSMFMNHLSSLAQTLIIFSTKEFGFIQLSDEYTTGSSIMPQKKNPDSLEVMKAKAAMCQGYLMSLLSMKDSVFIGYNRDLQWVKYVVMDAISEVEEAPEIIKGVLLTMKIDSKKMKEVAFKGFILAQAIMEGLSIDYAIPMRLAKMIVSNAVKNSSEADGIKLKTLNKSINEYGFLIKVNKIKFSEWIDPYSVASKQMKKEGL